MTARQKDHFPRLVTARDTIWRRRWGRVRLGSLECCIYFGLSWRHVGWISPPVLNRSFRSDRFDSIPESANNNLAENRSLRRSEQRDWPHKQLQISHAYSVDYVTVNCVIFSVQLLHQMQGPGGGVFSESPTRAEDTAGLTASRQDPVRSSWR